MREQITDSRNQREGIYSGYSAGRHRRAGSGNGYIKQRDWRWQPSRRQAKKAKMEPQDNDYEQLWPGY